MYYWIFGHFLLNALPVILYISLRQSPAARTPVLLLQGLQSSAARTAVLRCKDCSPRLGGLQSFYCEDYSPWLGGLQSLPARNGYTSSGNKKIYRVGKVSISCQRHTYIIYSRSRQESKIPNTQAYSSLIACLCYILVTKRPILQHRIDPSQEKRG